MHWTQRKRPHPFEKDGYWQNHEKPPKINIFGVFFLKLGIFFTKYFFLVFRFFETKKKNFLRFFQIFFLRIGLKWRALDQSHIPNIEKQRRFFFCIFFAFFSSSISALKKMWFLKVFIFVDNFWGLLWIFWILVWTFFGFFWIFIWDFF